MADFLLIHGSCHGAWCWRDLIPALRARGHSARAIDLPGSGDDPTPLADVTLDGCRDAVLAASTPNSIVVGHSWGGYPISAAAEANPDAMRALVYLCAYVPVSGLSMVDMRKNGPRQTLANAVQRDAAGIAYTIAPDQVPGLFYQDCPPEAVAYAARHLRPQAIAPQATPLTVGANLARLPRANIRCANDQTIPPEYQQQMTRDWSQRQVFEMQSSHSPFFADPTGLAALLDRISDQLGEKF